MYYDVYFGRLVTITGTSMKVCNIKTLKEVSKIVSEWLGCNVKITKTKYGFKVSSDDKNVIWEEDTKYGNIIITKEGNDFIRNEDTENRLEAIYEREEEISEEEVELLLKGDSLKVLENFPYDEWIYLVDEEKQTAIVGRYAPEVCITYYE